MVGNGVGLDPGQQAVQRDGCIGGIVGSGLGSGLGGGRRRIAIDPYNVFH